MNYLLFEMTGSENPFSSISDSSCNPVCGKDLLNISEKHNFSVVDASWFFGVTVSAWYEYTSDPQAKITNRYAKQVTTINEKRTSILKKLSSGPDAQLYSKLSQLDEQI